jgi:hypothetical protein
MGPLIFLGLVVVVSIVGTLVLWARSRPRAASTESSIADFNAKLQALSGDAELPGRSGNRRG